MSLDRAAGAPGDQAPRRLRVYTASSWKNDRYPSVVRAIRGEGFQVYDFRNPEPDGGAGCHWTEIDAGWRGWTPGRFRAALDHPLARRGFGSDYAGMDWADACALVLPSGRSSHTEAGWMKGRGKPTFVLLADGQEPELTYKLFDGVCLDVFELNVALATAELALRRRGLLA